MDKNTRIYVSRKDFITWLMILCMIGSALTQIAFPNLKGSSGTLDTFFLIILPVAASALFVIIILIYGKEQLYKTAISVWLYAIHTAYSIALYGSNSLVTVLFWIALIFFCVLYTQITCSLVRLWLLLPLVAAVTIAVLHLHKAVLLAMDWRAAAVILPDLLFLLGLALLFFCIRLHPADEYHPTWGDRPDGRRLRTLSPMSQVSPYIMVNRSGSTIYFEDAFEITQVERYIRQKRKEGLTNFGLTHVLLASYVRGLCRFPAVNRFLSGQKIYTHGEDVQFCMTIKKEMNVEAPDTIVKVHLSPRDTAEDVYRKLNAAVENVKSTPLDSSFDNVTHIFTMIPGVVLKFLVWVLKILDYFGLIPKFLLEVSPFHGSVFFTSMGSLGIPPVFHHLYDFGNLPVFCSFGCKRKATEVSSDGTVTQRKYIDCKFAIDERICDGYYYAAFFKHYKRILLHPEALDLPPEEVRKDID